MRKAWLIGLTGSLVAFLLVGAQSLQAGPTRRASFGAKLSKTSQPSNAESGQHCDAYGSIAPGASCTWMSVDAYRNAGHERAPLTGTIGRVRLVSCVAGSFRLQFARAKLGARQAKLVRSGPLISYKADPRSTCGGANGNDFIIQSFPVSAHVNKGDYIAIRASSTGTLYCSGGSGVLLFSPPLGLAGGYRHASTDASCNLLVQLQYK